MTRFDVFTVFMSGACADTALSHVMQGNYFMAASFAFISAINLRNIMRRVVQ